MAVKFQGGKAVKYTATGVPTPPGGEKPPAGWTQAEWDRLQFHHKQKVLKGGMLPVKGDGIRQGYYKMSDGLYSLDDDMSQLTDPRVRSAFAKLKQAADEFRRALDAKYLWD